MERHIAKILGYDVDLFSFDQAMDYIVKKSETQSTQTITLNPEMIELGDKNQEFSEILKNADLLIPDGFGIKLALKIYGISQERIPGIEFAGRLIDYCAKNSLPVTLIGAKEETLQTACQKLKEKNDGLNIVYARNGYFKEDDERAIVDEMKFDGLKFKLISVDGGGSKNPFVLQFLADMLNHDVVKSKFSESTVLGAIYVAMLSLKLTTLNDIKAMTESENICSPSISEAERKKNYQGWQKAIKNI